MDVILIGNDQTITLKSLRDEITNNFINDADVTATFKTKGGDVVVGPITLNYVVDSDGDYSGNLPNSVDFKNNKPYVVEIEADASSFKGLWHFTRIAQYREP